MDNKTFFTGGPANAPKDPRQMVASPDDHGLSITRPTGSVGSGATDGHSAT